MSSQHRFRFPFFAQAFAVASAGFLMLNCAKPPTPQNPANLDNLRDAFAKVLKAAYAIDVKEVDGELFQLAFPTENSVSLWHLYPAGATQRRPLTDFTIYRGDAQDGDPKLSDARNRRDINGPVDEKDNRLPDAPALRAERIEFLNLDPDQTYQIRMNGHANWIKARTKPKVTPERFSFLAFSCNNPFGVADESDEAKDTAWGTAGWKEQIAWKKNSLELFAARTNNKIQLQDFPNPPAFALGLGDQIYVDGDNVHGNVVTIFKGDRSEPTFKPDEATAPMLDLIYRAHFSLNDFNRGLQAMPTAMIWDDHELQDGWGTSENTPMQSHTWSKDYFPNALAAFAGFQDLRNPKPTTEGERGRDKPMNVDFQWGSQVRVMMLDTRSIRLPEDEVDMRRGDYAAWKGELQHVDKWLHAEDVDRNKPALFVLGLSSPLSLATNPSSKKELIAKLGGTVNAEIKDDLEDLWVSKQAARRDLLKVLTSYFLRHRKHRLLILSGDVHFSGINYLSTGAGSCFHDVGDDSCWDGYEGAGFWREFQPSTCQKPAPEGEDHYYANGAERDVLWGWEVISSGLTNDALADEGFSWYKRPLKRYLMQAGTVDDVHGNALMTTWPRGSIYASPSFAEILVDTKASPFNMRVMFYPSAYRKKGVNRLDLLNKGPLQLEDYDSYEGSRKSCSTACPAPNKMTAVPLEWDCIPNTGRDGFWNRTVWNCVHACSVIDPGISLDAEKMTDTP